MAQPPAQTAKAGFRLGIYVFKVFLARARE